MMEIPSGMNALYRQSMISPDTYSRKILIAALRWLMCSPGQVSLNLIAEELEHPWEDSMKSSDVDSEEDFVDEDHDSDLADFETDSECSIQDRDGSDSMP